jgi:thiol-disulfide isomerase/thioredoxin
MRKILFMCMVLLSYTLFIYAQEKRIEYPKVGEKIKDHTFTDLVNYPEKSLRISDYKGQWLIIDFWSRSCGACIASFPKINKLDQQFKGKVKIMMVGMYENNQHGLIKEESYIKKLFSDRAKRQNLQFTNAFDSVVLGKYDIWGLPAIFVLNPEGTIVAKTGKIDSADIADILSGKMPELPPNYSGHEIPPKTYNEQLPILTTGKKSNGGIDTSFLGRSIFARWQKDMPAYYLFGLNDENNSLDAIGFDLPELYRIAYTGRAFWFNRDSLYGKVSTKVILELKDSSLFKINNGNRNSNNTYAYQRTWSSKHISSEMKLSCMLSDLNHFLGLTSVMEDREVDVLNLVVKDVQKVAKLKSKGGERYISLLPDRPGTKMMNLPFGEFLKTSRITGALQHIGISYDDMPVIIDSTGIDFNINMNFDGDPTDLDQVLEVLHKHGLDLVKGKAKMRCIVISDSK